MRLHWKQHSHSGQGAVSRSVEVLWCTAIPWDQALLPAWAEALDRKCFAASQNSLLFFSPSDLLQARQCNPVTLKQNLKGLELPCVLL